MRKICLMFAALALWSSPAASEGWSGADLGLAGSMATCAKKAESVLYAAGADSVVVSKWMVQGYDIDDEIYDAVILCAQATKTNDRALVLVYTTGDRKKRMAIRDRIEDIWKARK